MRRSTSTPTSSGSRRSRTSRTAARRARASEHPPARRHLAVGREEHHLPGLVRNPKDEHLALEAGYPLRREVHHGYHLPSDEALRVVVSGELGAGPPLADLGSEIYLQLYRGLAGLWERLGRDDPADPRLHLLEVFPAYLWQADLLHERFRTSKSSRTTCSSRCPGREVSRT